MDVKKAATLAFIGTLLVTIVVAVDFFRYLTGVIDGIVPAMELVPCVAYVFGPRRNCIHLDVQQIGSVKCRHR
jgi:hypothetical protein